MKMLKSRVWRQQKLDKLHGSAHLAGTILKFLTTRIGIDYFAYVATRQGLIDVRGNN